MSTLKFKSKIEVPGIDVKGGNISGVNNMSANSFNIGNRTVIDTEGRVFTGAIYPSDERDFVVINTTQDLPAHINYMESQRILLNDTETNTSTAIGTKSIRTSAVNIGSPGPTGYTSIERYNGGLRYTDLDSADKIKNIILSDQNFGEFIDAENILYLENDAILMTQKKTFTCGDYGASGSLPAVKGYRGAVDFELSSYIGNNTPVKYEPWY